MLLLRYRFEIAVLYLDLFNEDKKKPMHSPKGFADQNILLFNKGLHKGKQRDSTILHAILHITSVSNCLIQFLKMLYAHIFKTYVLYSRGN